MKSLAALLPAIALLPFAFATVPNTEVLALRSGLSPEAFAAAGVASTSVAGVIGDLEASDSAQTGALATADAAYAAARQEVDALRRIVRSGQATQQQVTDLAQAKQDRADAEAARDAVLDDLFTAATVDLTTAQKTKLSTIRANAKWKAPTEFLVVNRTDEEWVELRDLLQHEKTCAKLGWDPEQDCVTRLAELRAVAAVATAKTNLDTNLTAVRSAWDLAVD